MRPSSTLDACGFALGVALLSLHIGEAFLCPTTVLGSSSRDSMGGKVQRQQQQQQQRRLAVTRWVVLRCLLRVSPVYLYQRAFFVHTINTACRTHIFESFACCSYLGYLTPKKHLKYHRTAALSTDSSQQYNTHDLLV